MTARQRWGCGSQTLFCKCAITARFEAERGLVMFVAEGTGSGNRYGLIHGATFQSRVMSLAPGRLVLRPGAWRGF